MQRRISIQGYLALFVAAFPLVLPGQSAEMNGLLRGRVAVIEFDNTRTFVPNATVTLRSGGQQFRAVANDEGAFVFRDIPTGRYDLQATAPGLVGAALVEVTMSEQVDMTIVVVPETVKDSVTVDAAVEPLNSAAANPPLEVSRSIILNAPNKDDRADSLLPLIPGVVRGPDGLINMKGTRASQSGSLVNGASVVDPVTGNPAMSLPVDVVESTAVIANPYDPEYGRLAGAVNKVETTTSRFDRYRLTAQNFLPRPRKRGGDFVGLESATPRATFTGPLVKNRIAFTESFEYRFVRTPTSSLPPLQRDMKFEGFTWFTQADINLSDRQSTTATFSLYPQKLNYLGLNTFTPQASTPDLHQRGYMAALQHRLAMGSDSLLVSQFSYKRFDVDITPNSADPYQLLVETTTGAFWNRQARESEHSEWSEVYQMTRRNLAGAHQLKIGVDFVHDNYDGRTAMFPVTIVGANNRPVEQIQFGPSSRFNLHQNSTASFAADHWQPIQRLTVDLGLRFDRDSITNSVSVAPRGGFALLLTPDGRTVLKGGLGLFYDRVPLNVASFPSLPGRTVYNLSGNGEVASRQLFLNAFPSGLRPPRSTGWNVEFDRQLGPAFVLRAAVNQRNTVRDFVLDPETKTGILALSNDGRSFYREFQLTGTYSLPRGAFNASYVHSQAIGNLNDFNQYFGNNAYAVVNADERGRLRFDAPTRFLAWGQWNAPYKLMVLPVLDLHTGFPYSRFNQERQFVGPRDSERLPRFTSLDLQVTRPVPLPHAGDRLKARVGFSVFNLVNHFNPRDVQADLDSDRYGAMFNGVGRTWRGKFVLEF